MDYRHIFENVWQSDPLNRTGHAQKSSSSVPFHIRTQMLQQVSPTPAPCAMQIPPRIYLSLPTAGSLAAPQQPTTEREREGE